MQKPQHMVCFRRDSTIQSGNLEKTPILGCPQPSLSYTLMPQIYEHGSSGADCLSCISISGPSNGSMEKKGHHSRTSKRELYIQAILAGGHFNGRGFYC